MTTAAYKEDYTKVTKSDLDYHELNAQINLLNEDGELQLDKDKEATRQYFLQHVNQNTVFFHDLQEKLDFLVDNDYYEEEVIEQYSFDFIKSLFKKAYAYHYRFETFMSAFKYYTSYTLKTFDGRRYLERYEDRVAIVSLYLARGDEEKAEDILQEIMSGRLQPATPTFLNAGKAQRGELVSCFLLSVEDNMESIARALTNSLQLSKRGGGVALNLTNLREEKAPIKNFENQSSGVIPVMKMLEDAFSYANQLGARQGAGAVYLNAHHPDILKFLDTKRENADEKIRIKTLSLGIVIPDIMFHLAKKDETMYLFSPYDVQKVYGKSFSEISVTEKYYEMVENPKIRKSKTNARELLQKIAEIQFESGYPYILFEDAANRANPIDGRIIMSNLCSEILQTTEASTFSENGNYDNVGKDISCNLASLNIANAFDSPDFSKTVETSIRALTAVSDLSNIKSVPSIERGNRLTHAIGLGQMNMHGFLAREHIFYDSPEALDFTNLYFMAVRYEAIKASNKIAKETGEKFYGFEKSDYANGKVFDKYIENDFGKFETERIKELWSKTNIKIPTQADWEKLKEDVMEHGIYNAYLLAVPPTGSISYINNSTSSIHPITSAIEIRKEGKLGRVYYPVPYLSEETLPYYKDAYEIGPNAIIDLYSKASEHTDQGLSLTLFYKDTATTRDLNKAYIYAFSKGNIKTLYYARLKNSALSGTEVESAQDHCVNCAL